MARKNYQIDEVLQALRKKHDVLVITNAHEYKDIPNNTVCLLSDKVWDKDTKKLIPNPEKNCDLGNGTWGKLDYLINHCGFNVYKSGRFPQKRNVKSLNY